MPIEITDCDDGRGTLLVSGGVVTDRDLIDALSRQLSRAAAIRDYRYLLFDFSGVTQLNIADKTVETVAELCGEASRSNPDPIVAIVAYFSMAVNIDMLNRISRMYEMFLYHSDWESLVFRTRMEAVRWIRKKVRDKFGIDDLTFD